MTRMSRLSRVAASVRRAWRRPGLVLGLWLLSLLFAAAFTLPVLFSLGAALNERPLGHALAQGQADWLFLELLSAYPDLPPVLTATVVGAALCHWMVATLLSGGLVQSLRRPGDPRRAAPGQLVQAAARSAGAMLLVSLAGALLRVMWLVLAGGAAYLVGRRLIDQSMNRGLLLIVLLLGAALLLWSLISVVLHFARAHALGGAGSVSGSRAVRDGLRTAWRAPGTTLLLGVCSSAGLLILCLLGRALASRLDVGLLVGTAFLVRQITAILRTFLGLAVMSVAVEEVDSQQRGEDWPVVVLNS